MTTRPPIAISKVLRWKKAIPARIAANRMKSTGTGPSMTGAWAAGMRDSSRCYPRRHGRHHLRRRPEAYRAAPRAAHVLRLRGLGLLDREHVPRERRGFPRDQIPPARRL